MSCEIIDCKLLFDAIRNKEDEYWKSGMILTLDIPLRNKYNLGRIILKNKKVFDWFTYKLFKGDDDYA